MIISSLHRTSVSLCGLLILCVHCTASVSSVREVQADFTVTQGPNTHYEAVCVGAGRVGELLRNATVDQMKDVHENCGFEYIRCHGLFHDDLGVYKEHEGQPIYNWQYVDMAYDTMIDNGITPFVELSFTPQWLASGTQTAFWWKANVSVPKNMEKWAGLVHEFTVHMEKRYGRDELKKWYFEVWNEPNYPAFFSTKPEDYFALYDASVKAIKSVCADYRVGGPSSAGNHWVPELIQHCNKAGIPMDFASTHTYGDKMVLDVNGKSQHFLPPGKTPVLPQVAWVSGEIAKSAMPKMPLLYTEWNSSCGGKDPVHDAYINAPFILSVIKHCSGYVKAMSYWTFTDVFEEGGVPATPFYGGFGLINLQGLHKPSYYAYKFMHQLGDEELKCKDPEAIVCRGKDGVQALIWNYTLPQQDSDNLVYYKSVHPAKMVGPATFSLKGLPTGQYRLQVFGIGYEHNDVYTDYLNMGSPSNLTREEVKALAEKNSGAPLLTKSVSVASGDPFNYQLEMRENDVYLITLKRLP